MESESKLKIYGDKDIFEKRLKEGYDKVSFGRGKLVNNEIICAVWVFYNTDKIATYEHPKSLNLSKSSPCRGKPYEREYSKTEFEEYMKNKKIILSKKMNLEEVVKGWEHYCQFLHIKPYPTNSV
jgi:hypothetical protein